jgi:hypothetical protein
VLKLLKSDNINEVKIEQRKDSTKHEEKIICVHFFFFSKMLRKSVFGRKIKFEKVILFRAVTIERGHNLTCVTEHCHLSLTFRSFFTVDKCDVRLKSIYEWEAAISQSYC